MMNKRSHTATTSSHWQELFQTLQHERVTQAEANLESFCQESQKRENALKAYISHLEQEVREAKKRKLCDEQDLENKLLANQQQQQQEKQILETKLDETNRELELQRLAFQKLEQKEIDAKERIQLLTNQQKEQETVLNYYKTLTGTTINITQHNDTNAMELQMTNCEKNTTIKFKLTELDNATDFNYEPIDNVKGVIPKFLHQAIEFPKSDGPSFLKLLLQGVFPE
jgi:hypothetical protein